ncbi:MAG: hypothetical protein KA384_09065 [Leptotrichiaceae bacterium]|jgi:hypothetical protein|nr:hypothetical protein [Leptotrichiaceae bacterium]MBP9630518.1 hypothetical protein [Leptotrichiaceae bacterium]
MLFRIVYVIVSFFPLFFILWVTETLNIFSIVRNGKEVESAQYVLAAIYFVVPIIATMIMCRQLNIQQKRANASKRTSSIKTKTIIQDRKISRNFFLSFVLPLVSMNMSVQSWNQKIVMWLLVIIILTIFVYSKKFDFNIIFLFTKYRKYIIDNEIIVIMNKKYESNLLKVLERYEFIKMQQTEVYLLNEETVILDE